MAKATRPSRSVALICVLAVSSLILGFSTAVYYSSSNELEKKYWQLSQEHDSLNQEYTKIVDEYRQLNQTYVALRLFNNSISPPSPRNTQVPQIFIVYPLGFEEYATAIMRICERARYEYSTTFWIDFPDVYIFIYTNASVRSLSTTPQDYRIYLYVRSIEDLKPPSISGLCHVYGFTHEMAHIIFTTTNPNFNEGWAYYAAGFRIVPKLYEALGDSAWPQPYNYSKTEGSERFLSDICNASLTQPGTLYAAARIMYTIDQKYGPGILVSAIGKMEPSYYGMYRYKVYRLDDLKNALVNVTGDASLLELFSENGF